MAGEESLHEELRRVAERLGLEPALGALASELTSLVEELPRPERFRAAVGILLLEGALSAGSTRLSLGDEELAALLRPAFGEAAGREAGAVRQVFSDPRLAVLVGPPGAGRPLARTDDYLAVARWVALEERLAKGLYRLLSTPAPPLGASDRVEAALADFRPALTPGQKEAVRAPFSHPLTLITGGPGSGKTTVVAAVIRTCREAGVQVEIGLAAPTGKAARRLTEAQTAICGREALEARTLHRLLGFQPRRGTFRHHPGHPLPHNLVVVDEASMVDLPLMVRLVEALHPGARLVLVGDADQLPSVEAGAVFRDLVAAASGEPWTVRLGASFRTMEAAASLQEAAAQLRAGAPDWFCAAPVAESPAALRFAGLERLPPEHLGGLLDRWFHAVIAPGAALKLPASAPIPVADEEGTGEAHPSLKAALASLERGRVLSLHREGPLGAAGVNAALRARHLRALGLSPHAEWAPGAPAMVVRNDYGLELFNGDTGIVAWFREGRRTFLGVAFPHGDRIRALPIGVLRGGVEPAYALTVHKSQGSEFDQVVVVLPSQESALLAREVLYTAVTRARRSVVLVGRDDQLAAAAMRRLERKTGLPDLLAAMLRGLRRL